MVVMTVAVAAAVLMVVVVAAAVMMAVRHRPRFCRYRDVMMAVRRR